MTRIRSRPASSSVRGASLSYTMTPFRNDSAAAPKNTLSAETVGSESSTALADEIVTGAAISSAGELHAHGIAIGEFLEDGEREREDYEVTMLAQDGAQGREWWFRNRWSWIRHFEPVRCRFSDGPFRLSHAVQALMKALLTSKTAFDPHASWDANHLTHVGHLLDIAANGHLRDSNLVAISGMDAVVCSCSRSSTASRLARSPVSCSPLSMCEKLTYLGGPVQGRREEITVTEYSINQSVVRGRGMGVKSVGDIQWETGCKCLTRGTSVSNIPNLNKERMRMAMLNIAGQWAVRANSLALKTCRHECRHGTRGRARHGC